MLPIITAIIVAALTLVYLAISYFFPTQCKMGETFVKDKTAKFLCNISSTLVDWAEALKPT